MYIPIRKIIYYCMAQHTLQYDLIIYELHLRLIDLNILYLYFYDYGDYP